MTAQTLTWTATQGAVTAAVALAATHDGQAALAVALALPLFTTLARRAHSRVWRLARSPVQGRARLPYPQPI